MARWTRWESWEERIVTPTVKAMLLEWGIPHVITQGPIGVRTYPKELQESICANHLARHDVFTEEFRTNQVWYQDWDTVRAMFNGWDYRYTLFFYYASERFAFDGTQFDNALDAMATWISADKVMLRIKIFDETDEQWEEKARQHIAADVDLSKQERLDRLPPVTKDAVWRSQIW